MSNDCDNTTGLSYSQLVAQLHDALMSVSAARQAIEEDRQKYYIFDYSLTQRLRDSEQHFENVLSAIIDCRITDRLRVINDNWPSSPHS